MKKNKYHTVVTVPNSNRKIVEKSKAIHHTYIAAHFRKVIVHLVVIGGKRVWRNQRGNQNPYIEAGQTT